MPLAKISTNAKLSPEEKEGIHDQTTKSLADCLKKPASVCMVLLQPECSMSFGENDSVCGLIEVSGIELKSSGANIGELTERLGGEVASALGAAPERVFVKISDVPRGMWGNGERVFY